MNSSERCAFKICHEATSFSAQSPGILKLMCISEWTKNNFKGSCISSSSMQQNTLPKKSTQWKGFSWFTAQWYSSSWQQEMWSSCHIVSTIKKQKVMNSCAQLTISFLFSLEPQVHGTLPSHLKWSSLIQKSPCRHDQSFISEMIPDPFKLIFNINEHKSPLVN